MNKEKKYEKPQITKHVLKINEVVLALCKTGITGGVGTNINKCQQGPTKPCNLIGLS